ncbi:type IX secretion system protein PorQ [Flavisolibacter tropicus]|uniref:Penicillin-binding protein n=1 Tax=Flavisolibacter tropicus TaxID=1492898 RepID=A0A172TSS6_9BACT|nr:type IX secretion system protein PorQ [Flavisolibacter tropicus]ANE50028.1 hypothetical protein SY85_05475 [Flavisolibacter tropicus]
MRFLLIVLFTLAALSSNSQTLGGKAAYSFLNLPASPSLSALGGVNISYNNNDVGLATNNPSQLTSNLHSQLGASFNAFFAGIKAYQLAGAAYNQKRDLTIGSSLFFIDYGNITQADDGGNVTGSLRPRDMVFQLSVGKSYLEKWHYGVTGKFIHSDYGIYQSSAIAFDVGVHYSDSSKLFSAAFLAKNMGTQLSTYYGEKEELPFDLQLGITKRLEKAPLGFSATLQQVHRWFVGYEDSLVTTTGFNKFFNHFVLATHVYIGKNLEVMAGYNRLRRTELNINTGGNGLNGFSTGFKASFKKLQVQYARAYFQRAGAYNQFGLNLKLNSLIQSSDL